MDDDTAHTQGNLQQSESNSSFHQLLHEIPSVAFQGYTGDGTIRYWNLASERMYGYTAQEAIGRNLTDLIIPPEMREETGNIMKRMIDTGQNIPATEQTFMHKDGSAVTVLSCHVIIQKSGEPAEFFRLGIDISERKRNEERLEYLATHDELTGMANRTLLSDRLAQSLHYAHRSGRLVAVMLFGIDRFKVINDSLGHAFGDKLLRAVAERLFLVVRASDTIARLGCDEFVILLTEITKPNDVGHLAARILHQLDAPFQIEDREITVTASLGISIFPKDSDNGGTLIRNADIAMHRVKQEGGDSFSFYAPEMNQRAIMTMELESNLRRALECNEFCLYYQPKVDLTNDRISGCEALVRWKHPQRGMVAPDKFIPLAEETGLIVRLGAWVMREACRQAHAWQTEGWPDLSVAVNISARQFRKGDFPQLIREILDETGLDPRLLELEMTESMVMDNSAKAALMLAGLKRIGIRLSLDDFGIGYSSLSCLSKFPIDHLKIDRSFVNDIISDPASATIVSSISVMAHQMHLKVIAEGVETSAQLAYLRKHACDEIQGYYFSRPLSAEEFTALLRQGRSLDSKHFAATDGVHALLIADYDLIPITHKKL
jgi:diguanylate cyclase (GGDEF)-like protein/PAS domain S-box-containing protein